MTGVLAALFAGIDRVLPDAAALRREIHAFPHLGGDEMPTRDMFTEAAPWLDWSPVAGTGGWARLGPDGASVALRAELDALPMTEDTGVEWSSERRGIMHACGHDVHLAALWAVLQAARSVELPAGLVALLQPREEVSPTGAGDVVSSGLLDDEDIEAMIGVHVQPLVARGVVSTGAGAVNAAFDAFTITVHGRGGHGAYPHNALDPITVLASIITGLSELTAQQIDPTQPTVVSVGQVVGGTAPNVIASSATCHGTIRTFSSSIRDHLHEAIPRLAEGIAFARGAAVAVDFQRGGPALVNDFDLVARVDSVLGSVDVPVAPVPFRSCGSDDFAEYGQVVPSVMCFAGTGGADGIGLHHPRFLPGRDALPLVARTYAAAYVAAAGKVGREASD